MSFFLEITLGNTLKRSNSIDKRIIAIKLNIEYKFAKCDLRVTYI